MTAAGLDRARQALRRDDPGALVGERECVWLDVKDGIYPLDQPKGAEELAKDVAAFANTADGGLLLVGFSTRKEHGEEIVDELNPIPRKLIDLDKHRQIIATRVFPPLRHVSVDWISCTDELGVLVIDIPAQPRASQLFAVPAPNGKTEPSKTAVSVPIRRGDGTTWLRPHEIQHFVGLGWANSGDEIDKLTAALASIQAPQRAEEPAHTVGGGAPGWSGIFQQAVDDLAAQGLVLGEPVTDVDPIGPGVAQHFAVPGEPSGWVLCARPKHRPVAVAEEIWQALQDHGSGTPDGDALAAMGFPAGNATATSVVDRRATEVPLSGGRWCPARLVRGTDGWWWDPDPIATTTTSAATRNWTATMRPPQLRARVLATLPWDDLSGVKITPDRLNALLLELPISQLAGFTTNLSQWRGRDLPAGTWDMGPNDNASDRFSYAVEITAPDGEPAVSAEVMMTLPPAARSSAVITCAEVRVENFDAWARALHADPRPDLRWTTDDLLEFFVAAWETATELLPRLIRQSPATESRWTGVPLVEFSVRTEQRHDQAGSQLVLRDVLDLEPFGPNGKRGGELSELFVSLPAVPGLAAETRRSRARSALVDMAHSFGFMQVRADTF
ncbi:RNA-binding domain-containing protein [Amycolatopsis sp. NPDC004378]